MQDKDQSSFNKWVYDPSRASAGYLKLVDEIRSEVGVSLGPALCKHVINARSGKVVNIMARSGHGKTTFMSALARLHAKQIMKAGRDSIVSFASWETPVEELEAFFQPKPDFDVTDLAWGRVPTSKVQSLTGQRMRIPIWTIGNSLYNQVGKKPMTVDELYDSILQIKERTGKKIEALFVDYIQAIYIPDESQPYNQVSRAAMLMTQLSIAANVPIILGVQANQRVDDILDRNKKKDHIYPVPRMRDGEWSAKITQKADTVLGLWRPEKTFNPKVTPQIKVNGDYYDITPNLLVVDLLKQRWERGSGRFVMNMNPATLELSTVEPSLPSQENIERQRRDDSLSGIL